MYADRVEDENRKSVKERLEGNSLDVSSRRPPVTRKRQRQDDKWEHDLYEDDEPQAANHRLGSQDLRLKLRRKGRQQASQSGNGSIPGVWDLRDRLSGTMHSQPANIDPPKQKSQADKPTRQSVVSEVPLLGTKRVSNSAPVRRTPQKEKNDTSVDDFLLSLGLEKYSITFQAEEVDMTALVHMSDEDLKVLGIPMGPRKKILLTLQSRD